MNKKLLEQYIKNIVQEELQKEDTISAAFIDPIKDIWDTFKAGVEDMSVRTQALVKTMYRGLGTLFVPFMDADYKGIAKEEKEKLEAVQKKYAEVFARNDDAFYNTDLMPITFLKNPQMFLGAKLAEKLPGVAISALEVMTGGNEKVAKVKQWLIDHGIVRTGQSSVPTKRSDYGSHDTMNFAQGIGLGYGTGGMGNMDGMIDYGSVYEAGEPPQQPQAQNPHVLAVQYIKQLLADKEIQNAINSSPIVQNMKKDALSIYIEHAAKFLSSKSFDELMSQHGSQLSSIKTTVEKELAKAKPEEVEEIKAATLAQLKTQYKDYYIKKFQQMAQQDSGLQAAVSDAISKIKAMN